MFYIILFDKQNKNKNHMTIFCVEKKKNLINFITKNLQIDVVISMIGDVGVVGLVMRIFLYVGLEA